MSSSDEEVVRRPGRSTDASRVQSPSASERSANGHAESPLGSDRLNDDDDADLFGSDGDGDLEEEYDNTLGNNICSMLIGPGNDPDADLTTRS